MSTSYDLRNLIEVDNTGLSTSEFNGIEINPVVQVSQGVYDVCNEDDPNIAFWCVYVHQNAGGVICIADCLTAKAAQDFAELLEVLFKKKSEKFEYVFSK
jgi:hypothetical protein